VTGPADLAASTEIVAAAAVAFDRFATLADAPPPAPGPVLDVDGARMGLLAKIDPETTVAARVRVRLDIRAIAGVAPRDLVRELKAAGGDHRVAFARYRAEMREYVDVNLKLGAKNAKQMVAATPWALRTQILMMRYVSHLPWKDLALRPILKPLNAAANAITLKSY